MKILEKNHQDGVRIQDLEDGVVFRWENMFYVRTSRTPGAIAVGIDGEGGYLASGAAHDRVIAYPDAVLVLEPEDGQ